MSSKLFIVQTVALSQQTIISHLTKTFVVNCTIFTSVKKILLIKNYVTNKSGSHVADFISAQISYGVV